MGPIPLQSGYQFRVWAPNAISVWISGDFTNNEPVLMQSEYWQGTWVITIDSAVAYQTYQYQISDGVNLYIRGDPYGRLLNDTDWPSFPVTHPDPSLFDWQNLQYLSNRPTQAQLVIYELHVGTFNQGGMFNDVIARLDYLQYLGITAIELLPTQKVPSQPDWGYDPVHTFSTEPNYGGMDGLKTLIRECHRREIAVIMDVVFNHMAGVVSVLEKFDYYSANYVDGIWFFSLGIDLDTEWGPRPNYDQAMVSQYFLNNLQMLVEDFGVDGFRWDSTICIRRPTELCWDSVDTIPSGIAMMQQGNTMLANYGVISIAEDLQSDYSVDESVYSGGLGFPLQWNDGYTYDIINYLLVPRNDADRILSALQNQLTLTNQIPNRVIYLESHDNADPRVPDAIDPENPTSTYSIKLSMMGLAMLFTSPGVPMIFMGEEYVEIQNFTLSPFASVLNWTQVGNVVNGSWTTQGPRAGLVELTRDLIRIKLNANGNVLGMTSNLIGVYHMDTTHQVIAFHRWNNPGMAGDDTVIVMNLDRANITTRIGFPAAGEWMIRLNSDLTSYYPTFTNVAANMTSVSTNPILYDEFPNSAMVTIGGYSTLIFSQNPPTPTSTPTPTPTPEATSAPTAAPTSAIQYSAVVSATFRLLNIQYSWYTANAQVFQGDFISFIANLLSIPESTVTIISIVQGSLIVDFNVATNDPTDVENSLNGFISNPNFDSLNSMLPPAAFQNSTYGVTLDPGASLVQITSNSNQKNPMNVGAIVGGVIGGIAGAIILTVVIYFLVFRKKDQPKKKNSESSTVELKQAS